MIQKRGEIHLAFAMYMIDVIIPHSSIRRTIPVAFIYKNLTHLQNQKFRMGAREPCHAKRVKFIF